MRNSYNVKVNEVEALKNKFLNTYKAAQEEDDMLKDSGVKWMSSDRNRVRKEIKKSRSEYDKIFNTTPTASSIDMIKDLVKKEELPKYMALFSGEASRRGISINEYIEFMKTPKYDEFLDSKNIELEEKYKVKKKNLESIVGRGSKK